MGKRSSGVQSEIEEGAFISRDKCDKRCTIFYRVALKVEWWEQYFSNFGTVKQPNQSVDHFGLGKMLPRQLQQLSGLKYMSEY